jgi:two-component system OmpR family response regulator
MTALASSTTLRRADGSAPRILVVDDEQMLTDLLSMALRMEGWDVKSAGSGFQALQVARDFEPDAMVLDIMMPDLIRETTCRSCSSPRRMPWATAWRV